MAERHRFRRYGVFRQQGAFSGHGVFVVRRCRGVSSVELIVALPVLLLLLLAIIQFVLVFHAKHSLDYALNEAARQGAVAHADPAAIKQGLANGLAPWLHGAKDWKSKLTAEAQAMIEVESGMRLGWLRLAQRSPTLESFEDWAEPALDAFGERIQGMDEIPNDNLNNRRLKTQPRSGSAGLRRGEPVGQRSGQTLGDANLLRLEMDYGVRLSVPLIGRLVLGALSSWNGCGDQALYQVGTPDVCRYYKARTLLGKADGRIPVKVVATMRMMSPARRSDWLQAAMNPPPQAGAAGGALKPLGSPQPLGTSGGQDQAAGADALPVDNPARDEGLPEIEPPDMTDWPPLPEDDEEDEEDEGDAEGAGGAQGAEGTDNTDGGKGAEGADVANRGAETHRNPGTEPTSPTTVADSPWSDVVRPKPPQNTGEGNALTLNLQPEHPAVCTAPDQQV
ncbi:MAG: TadE/TadG family type IV pilus assembly protein [Lautropia sp.]|nr:TadE/TadG family type IV pilus assembly protein [Lautropia sp.]